MANEISWATLETDAGLAHMLAGDLHADLFDPTDLRSVCTRRPFRAGGGSEATKVTRYNPAHTFSDATSELVGGASNEDQGTSNFELTVARKTMVWEATDLWRLVAPQGSIDLDLLRAQIVRATGLTFTDVLCALFPSVSGAVGSPTGQMSLDFMYDGQYALNDSRVQPPYDMVLAPHCFNKWQESLRGAGGSTQFKEATQGMVDAKGPGFKGSFGLINIHDADSVALDGGATYRRNAIFGAGAFEYQEAPVPMVTDALPANTQTIIDGIVRIIHEYSAANALTQIHGDYYPGVSEAEDARARVINALAA